MASLTVHIPAQSVSAAVPDVNVSIPALDLAVLIPTPPTQRGMDAAADLKMDPTGVADCSPLLQKFCDYLTTFGGPELHFPPGRYYFKSPVVTNAHLVKLVGDGQVSNIAESGVVFFTDQPLQQLLWFNCGDAASNLQSVWLEHIQFEGTAAAQIRISNEANLHLNDVGGLNLRPQRSTAGAIGVSHGSKIVTGAGTAFSAAVLPGFIVIGGYPYEIASVESPASLTLAMTFLGPSGAGLPYAVNAGGVLLWLDPGAGWTQYGDVFGLKAHGVGCAIYCSAGNGPRGTSRVKFHSGYVNGGGIPDCIAAYFGPYSDTMKFSLSANSFAFGVVIANGHMHNVTDAEFENASAAPAVTGSTPGYTAAKGVVVMADSASAGWGNRITNCIFRQVGTAIELLGVPAQTKLGANVFRSNSVNFAPGAATQTAGECDGKLYGVLTT